MVSLIVNRHDGQPARDERFTVSHLDELPNDSRRYELIDGVLLVSPPPDWGHVRHELIDGVLFVSPAPRWEHQRASNRLGYLLEAACPDRLVVLPATDIRDGAQTRVQPDLGVVRAERLVPGESLAAVPVLAVEILSPSSLSIDWLLKRDVYARLGVEHYWIVDLIEPSVTVLMLDGNGYREHAVVHGNVVLAVDEPFSLTFRPDELIRPR